MTATGHALVGAAIASKIQNPAIAIPLILASHFLGDAIPHWDTATNWRQKGLTRVFWETSLDLAVATIIVGVVFIGILHADPVTIYWGMFVSLLPDFLEFPYFFLNWQFPPFTYFNDFQHLFHSKKALPWGIINQMAVVLVFLLFATIK